MAKAKGLKGLLRYPDDEEEVEKAWKEDRRDNVPAVIDVEQALRIAGQLREDQGRGALVAFLEKCRHS